MQEDPKIKRLKARDSKVYLNQGDSCFKNQKYEQSIVLYDLVLTIDPQSSQAYINKGKVYVIRKHYDEANRMFDKAFQLNPSDYQVYFNRGNIHFAKKEYEKAKEKYAHAITLNNQDSELFEKYGDTLSALGNMEDSIKLYQQGIQISQNHQTYEKIRDRLLELQKVQDAIRIYNLAIRISNLSLFQSSYTKQQNEEKYLQIGDQFKNQKKYSEAIQFYQLAIQIHPSRGYLRIGNALISQGRLEEAFTILNDARQYFDIQDFKRSAYEHLNNNQIDVFILFQKLALNMSDENNKIEIFLDFGNYKNYLQGDKMICKDQVEEAFKMYKLAAQYNPNCSLFLKRGQNEINRLGDDFFQDKKFDIALQFYELLTLLDPKQGYLKQGDTLMALGKIQDAIFDFKKAIQNKARENEFIKRGDLYFKLEKFDIALQFYELLCEINPLKGYMKLGDYESAQKNMEQAFSWFDKVIEFKPNDVHFYKELEKRGDKKFNEEQYQTALQFYKLETKLNKKMGFLKQGDTYVKLDRMDQAKQSYINSIESKQSQNCIEYQSRGQYINYQQAINFFKQKKYQMALFLYDILITLYPEIVQHQINKGEVLYAIGQSTENLEQQYRLNKQFQQTKYNKNQDFISKSAWDYHKVLILQEQGIYRVSQQQKDKIEYVGQKLVQYK